MCSMMILDNATKNGPRSRALLLRWLLWFRQQREQRFDSNAHTSNGDHYGRYPHDEHRDPHDDGTAL